MCGDVVGKAGRRALTEYLPVLREKLNLDFVVVNGENAAHGFGINQKICNVFFDLGVDVITSGNHIWDQKQIINFISNEPRLLRPVNFINGTPGNGFGMFIARNDKRVLVINVIGNLFMEDSDDPFQAIEEILVNCQLGLHVDAILIDVHAEATSEKQAIAHACDGRVSAIVGTHTHVPTSDYQILSKGSGYQSDLGMTGDYNSIIGMQKYHAIARFTQPQSDSSSNPKERKRLEPAEGTGTLCGVFIETCDDTGLVSRISPVRVGGTISTDIPYIS